MARPRKPPELRQNRATRDLEDVSTDAELVPWPTPDLEVVDGDGPPTPDAEWLADTRRQWIDLWGSPLVSHLQATDMAELRRCFMWRDELARCRRRARTLRREAEREALVEGSKGQPVANPLFEVAAGIENQALAIERAAVALEDRLGLSPKARIGLGVSTAKGLNLTAQNAQLASAIERAMRGDGANDPRSLPRDPAADAL